MRHAVEERLQRLLAIMAAVAGRGPVAVSELVERFDVSEHQLRKDLTLAMFMGASRYVLPGETPEVVFEGDTVTVWAPVHFEQQPALTRPEAFAVLAAGRAAVAMAPDLDALASAMDRLAEALEVTGEPIVELDEPEQLDIVRTAVRERRRLQVKYWSAWRDELTERTIDPLQLVFLGGDWYVLAADDRSGEHRRFRVDRLASCEPTGEVFDPVAFEPISEVFEAPPFAVRALVRFPSDSRWITEYGQVEIIDESEDHFVAEVVSVGETWLARFLLRSGGEVLEPAGLADLRTRAALAVLDRYRSG